MFLKDRKKGSGTEVVKSKSNMEWSEPREIGKRPFRGEMLALTLGVF